MAECTEIIIKKTLSPAPGSPAKPPATWVKDANGWSVRVKTPAAAAAEKRAADPSAEEAKETKRSRTEHSDENICETLGKQATLLYTRRYSKYCTAENRYGR